MKKHRSNVLLFMFALLISACGGGPDVNKGGQDAAVSEISALGAIGGIDAFSGPLYEGDGGQDIRLAILAPEAQGSVSGYLPLYIQGLLNNNFKKCSAVTLIDRQYLDKIILEQDIGASGRFSEKDFVSIGELTNTQYFLFGTVQKLSGERYSLQLSITDSSYGIRRANFMKDGTLVEIEGSGELVNEASAELLEQMGVRLTEAGRQTLLAGSRAVVQAQTELARGITAQAVGAEVEALFNFSQSIAFDPSQIEALSRLSILSSGISGGTISQRIVSDIQARDRWLEVFKEAARFFNKHPPFEISFDPNLMQEGATDYVKRTANIAMRIALDPSEAGFGVLNALLHGLENTGKRTDWGFAGWPLSDISPKTKGTVVFEGKHSFSFKVDVKLVNENNKTIGKNSITLETGIIHFAAGDEKVSAPDGDKGLIRFPKIKTADLTPTLTIVITSVNGIPSRILNNTGYMRIDARDLEGKQVFNSAAQPAPVPTPSPVQMVDTAGTIHTPVHVYSEENYLPMHKLSSPPYFEANAIADDLVYPSAELKSGIEGRVILELFVDCTGSVQKITILREEPEGRGFGEAAVNAFTGRKGRPAIANGEPVSARYRYPVAFKIK